ncbi:hypothetical protein ZHAS_00007594 [Anopheles sinensis]|uniref:Small ribosomal subunit protein mS29 n=1 Tax=Anopheles sinensis TaxID=74873 RepID=A0A084VQH4_ANOSI|nr:hypothetical protein ZHAS_00007594 [Anopheles sinensis]
MMIRRIIRGMSYSPRVRYSTATANAPVTEKFDEFRTIEQNPANHSRAALSRFYTVPVEVRKQIFAHGGLPKNFEKQVKTFNECCLMVRQPAVEIIEHLQRTDFERPVNRFVLYGEDGAGKSLTLAHLLHYGHQQQYVLVHVPWVPNWMKRARETANSSTVDGALDLPLDGAAWLVHFKSQNGPLLNRLGLTVSRDYVWTKRETTPAGAPLLALVEHAQAALLLGQGENDGADRRLQCLFHPHTRILTENKVRITPDRITLTRPFLDITRNDWTNGVCVLAVDRLALTEERMASCLPKYLLYREGFEHLDPFVPIRVDGYNDSEYHSCIQYYLDRKWIQAAEPGFEVELKMLSCQNPYQLMQLCSSL